mmetsp:Transcript_99498/g.264445  ORF Transcript_99498/g.264445 Transcript_99498/m.264445 type:complete len:256 (-) Transcript_99498:337-1104(-)
MALPSWKKEGTARQNAAKSVTCEKIIALEPVNLCSLLTAGRSVVPPLSTSPPKSTAAPSTRRLLLMMLPSNAPFVVPTLPLIIACTMMTNSTVFPQVALMKPPMMGPTPSAADSSSVASPMRHAKGSMPKRLRRNVAISVPPRRWLAHPMGTRIRRVLNFVSSTLWRPPPATLLGCGVRGCDARSTPWAPPAAAPLGCCASGCGSPLSSNVLYADASFAPAEAFRSADARMRSQNQKSTTMTASPITMRKAKSPA